ncbi:MAG TPA: Asp-tRNA(Asn)/Glu-tRNA(Gln) amidotransferase subunit GatB [Chloroflexota bacterium]
MTEATNGRWEAVIGLEVHAQLMTRSKMFCRCSSDYASAPPNTHVCPVCLGLPGALPVINRRAIELTVRTGLALGCQVADFSRFDRKNYFYADLMKGYQISQYDLPLCTGGELLYLVDGQEHRAGVTRVHLEEDTAKHVDRSAPGGDYSLIDVNRAGVPLIEIVGEPDLRTPEQARAYMRALRGILRYVAASSGNMEEGALRCDVNVSVRPTGAPTLGTKVELKNLNSFRAIYNALRHEIARQIELLEGGGKVVQETRGWDETRGVTVGQRTKEYAHDYRYFPEPDLPPLTPDNAWIEAIRGEMPELPAARRARYAAELGLSGYDAALLAAEREIADFFEHTCRLYPQPKTIANWINGDVRRSLGEATIEQAALTPDGLAELLRMVERGEINRAQGVQVLETLVGSGGSARAIADARGFKQVSDEVALAALVDEAIANSPKSVADYRAGKTQALGFLVGQVMKATRGQANPAVVNRLLVDRLTGDG